MRAIQVGSALAAALFSPVAWWLKILIFLGIMFVIGFIVQYREINRQP